MRTILLLLPAVFLCSILSHAKSPEPLRDIRGLVNPKPENAFVVETARVLLADYALIREDFPSTRSMTEAQIDQWLPKQIAIAEPQTQQEVANSKINIKKDSAGAPIVKRAYRPEAYGRALVFEVDGGLMDVKGAGALNPQLKDHRTGLASLGEAIREYLFQKIIQRVLTHSGIGLHTVKTYAVVDWGFDTKELNGHSVRAGGVVRAGNARPPITPESHGNHFANVVETKIIEDVLRKYGITSTGDAATATHEGANIQVSKDGLLIDFGAFLVADHFKKIVIHYGSEELLSHPSWPSFVQPDPRLQLPLHMWGATATGVRENPQYDNAWFWSHQLAHDIKHGHAQRKDAIDHFNNFMNPSVLPKELEGSFKYVTTNEFRARTAYQLFANGAKLQTATLKIIFAGPDALTAEQLEKVLLSEAFQKVHPENVLTILNQFKVLEKHPQLWGTVVKLAKPGINGSIFGNLLAANKASLIETVISKPGNVSERVLQNFLNSEVARANPLWKTWVATANKTYSGFAANFMALTCEDLF